jgi:UDP-3-O-[3-hydroxymyristoyl] glucosamine N-acyltransferase
MRLGDIATALGATLEGDADVEIVDLAPIDDARPGTLTFLADRRLEPHLATTAAAAVLLATGGPPTTLPALRVEQPYLAFARALALFHPATRPPAGVHPTAVVAPDAVVGPNASIGARVVVGAGVVLGADAVLHPGVVLYPRVRVGDGFVAHAGAVVREDVVIGHRVVLHAGAVIGSDGFGFVPDPRGHVKIPQVGTVVLEDDVEIGANATVDRATMGATVVGRGAKLDNLVMVGHGSRIGSGCLLAGQVGMAGSTTLGRFVMLGGQVGLAGHLTVGDGVQVAAQTGVDKDLAAGKVYGSGFPPLEARQWRRVSAAIRRLPDLLQRLRAVERRLGIRGAAEEAE